MCVIIAREPGIVFPYEKFVSACHVNSDGYGLSVIDRGKIEMIKEMPQGGNTKAIDAIYKRMNEEAKDQKVFLHLRFRTAGKVNDEACHPFNTLTTDEDGFHIQFMHNGTLYDFDDKASDLPDSYHFNMRIVRPLMQRIKAFATTDDQILQDDLARSILTKYAGANSKFVLFDQNGNEMIINRKDGYEEEGWWASNKYSFDRTHREPANYKAYGYYGDYDEDGYNTGYRYPSGWKAPENTSGGRANASTNGGTTTPFLPTNGNASAAKADVAAALKEALADDGKQVGGGIKNANMASRHVQPDIIPPTRRETFVELTELGSLAEVGCLEQDDIQQIVENYPELATVLIMDLIYELYLINTNVKKVA
jgi:predicted glutamine amidotransferase